MVDYRRKRIVLGGVLLVLGGLALGLGLGLLDLIGLLNVVGTA